MSTRKLTLKSCAVRGPQGRSAYEAAVEAGYEGTAADYYAIIGGIPDELTRINISQGRQDAILEYHGTQISALQNEDTRIKSRVSSLEAADSSMGASIQTLQDGLAQAKEIAENPAFPEQGTNAHVVPSLSTETGNVKVLNLNGNNPDGLPHVFTPVLRNVAAPVLAGDAANKGYVDQTISDQMATKRYVPSGGDEQQVLAIQGGTTAWRNERAQTLGIWGREVSSSEQSFTVTGLNHSLAEIKNMAGSYTCLPFFVLARLDGSIRYLQLAQLTDTEADFWSDKISGVSTEAILVRVTADGAAGTKY